MRGLQQTARCGLFAMTLALCTLAVAEPAARAQSTRWSQPRQVANTLHKSWFPTLASDASGMVHLAYASNALETKARLPYDMVEYLALRDGVVSRPRVDIVSVDIEGDRTEASRPHLFATRDGKLHMTWRTDRGVHYTQAPIADADRPIAWRVPVRIGEGYFSQIAADSTGTLHILHTENVMTTECPLCYHVFHTTSTDGGVNWSSKQDISVLATGAVKPQLLITENDQMHVVWEIGRGGAQGQAAGARRVGYAQSLDRGATWSEPLVFAPPGQSGQAAAPAIARAGDGQLLVAWMSPSDDFFYSTASRDNGQTWSVPQRIPGLFNTYGTYEPRLDTVAMATDSAGRVHVIAVGRADAAKSLISVFHLQWINGVWAAPETLTSNDFYPHGDAPQWPSIAVSNGNRLYAVWYQRRGELLLARGEEPPPYEIFYASALIDAPELAAQPFPTQAPTAMPSAPSQAKPAASVRPAISAEIPAVTMQSLMNEYALLRILLLALMPLVALSAGVLIVRRIGRR